MCRCNQVLRNIIKLGLGVEEVGQWQQLIVRGTMQAQMEKQRRDYQGQVSGELQGTD